MKKKSQPLTPMNLEKNEFLTCVKCHAKVYVYENNKLIASPKLGYSKIGAYLSLDNSNTLRYYNYWCPCCKEEGRPSSWKVANVSYEIQK